mgnify:CR=1 FL=1
MARNPIFVSGEFIGLAIAVLDVPVIVEAAFPDIQDSGYGLRLTDSAGNTFYNSGGDGKHAVERDPTR